MHHHKWKEIIDFVWIQRTVPLSLKNNSIQNSTLGMFVLNVLTNMLQARAVLIDMEEGVVNQLLKVEYYAQN